MAADQNIAWLQSIRPPVPDLQAVKITEESHQHTLQVIVIFAVKNAGLV